MVERHPEMVKERHLKTLDGLWVVWGSGLLLLVVILLAPTVGSQPLNWREVWEYLHGQSTRSGIIFFQLRLPRVLLAALAGGGLAVAGVVFQALLRNPLATPYTLGISAGSALGAVLAIKWHLSGLWLGFSPVQWCALGGGLATLLLVMALARSAAGWSIHTLVLAGVTMNYFLGALILFAQYLADFTETIQMVRWMMGQISTTGTPLLMATAGLVISVSVILWILAKPLDLISTSPELALSRGVSVQQVQWIALSLAALVTAGLVALCGPIGFVGLVVPHVLRMLAGPAHRVLIMAALFTGAAFLLLADTLARTLIPPVDLPVGILTALVGGPFFLWLLFRREQVFL
ncbi:MAG: iron ABC transporter permease [Calditrichaeota bacterium]|nr:MAG: iron ABC transporter permease [Calditrichota bacterium]